MHFATYNTRNMEEDASMFIYFLAQTKNLKRWGNGSHEKQILYWQKVFLKGKH